jgi:hypothetical protein
MPLSQDGEQRYTRHGRLVADFVEVFAPVVFEPYASPTRPDGWIHAELRRNTPAPAPIPPTGTASPTSTDACWAWFSTNPGECGVGSTLILLGDTAGQITHQPAWSLFALLKLAGVDPTSAGYRVTPHLPLPRYSLRMPAYGIAVDGGSSSRAATSPRGRAAACASTSPRAAGSRRIPWCASTVPGRP